VREELLGELAILSNLSMWRWGGIQRWSYFHDRYAPSRARLLRWQGFLTAGQRAEQFWWKSGLGAEYLLQRPNAEPGIAAFVHAALSGAPLAGELQSEGTLYTTERRTYRLQAELAWKEPIAGFQLRGSTHGDRRTFRRLFNQSGWNGGMRSALPLVQRCGSSLQRLYRCFSTVNCSA
jgi:hypothetical protein